MREVSTKQRTNISFKPTHAWHEFMNMPEFVPLDNRCLIQETENVGSLMSNIDHRPKPEIFVEQRFYHRVLLGQSNVHLNGALRVANVINLLLGLASDVAEGCWKVIVSHMLECKFPETSIFVGVELCMVARMLVTTIISHPNIEPLIGEDEARCLILIVYQPSIRTVEQSVLQVNRS